MIKAGEAKSSYYISGKMLRTFDDPCTSLTNILNAATKSISWGNIIKKINGDNDGFLIDRERLLEKITPFKKRFSCLDSVFANIDILFPKELDINNKENEALIYKQFEFLQNYLIPVMINDCIFYAYLRSLSNSPLFYYLNKISIISLERHANNEQLRISNEEKDKQIQQKNTLLVVMFCLGFLGTCYINRTVIVHYIY